MSKGVIARSNDKLISRTGLQKTKQSHQQKDLLQNYILHCWVQQSPKQKIELQQTDGFGYTSVVMTN